MTGARTASEAARRRAGLSYVEVLIATLLLAVSLLPALDALQSGILGAEVHEALAVEHPHLVSKLDELLALPLAQLDAAALAAGGPGNPTSFSDAPGTPSRRLVYLARYDGDGADGDGDFFTGGDVNLLWLRVALEGTPRAIETLTSAD